MNSEQASTNGDVDDDSNNLIEEGQKNMSTLALNDVITIAPPVPATRKSVTTPLVIKAEKATTPPIAVQIVTFHDSTTDYSKISLRQ